MRRFLGLIIILAVVFAVGCSRTKAPPEPGPITVGTSLNTSKTPPELAIAGVKPLGPVAFIAQLNRATKSTQLTITIASNQSQQLIYTGPLPLAAPGFDTVWGQIPLVVGMNPGTYRIRIIEQDEVLAHTDFVVR